MEKITFHLLIIILISSCGVSNNNEDIYIDYISTSYQTRYCEKTWTGNYFEKLRKEKNDLVDNCREEFIFWYELSLELHEITNEFYNKIEQIKLDICKTDRITITDLQKIKQEKYSLDKEQVEKLIEITDLLKTFYIESARDYGNPHLLLYIEEVTEKWLNQNILDSEIVNSLELIAILSKNQRDIIAVEKVMLNYYKSSGERKGFHFNSLVYFIDYKETDIKLGDSCYVSIDVGYNEAENMNQVYVSGERIFPEDGKFIYRKNTKDCEIGKITELGEYHIIHKYRDDTLIVPFTIKYNIVK